MLGPAQVRPGDTIHHVARNVDVTVINADGGVCWVKFPTGEIGPFPYNAFNTSVRSGPLPLPANSKAAQILTDVLRKNLTPEEAAPHFVAEQRRDAFRKTHPVMGFLAENATVHEVDPLGPGGVLIEKATGRAVTIFAGSAQRELWVCKLANGAFEVFRTDELLTGDRLPIAPAAAASRDGDSLIAMATRISGGGTLQKRASGFKDGQRVRLSRAARGIAAGAIGTVHGDVGKAEAYVRFATNSGESYALIKAELLEII